VCHKPSRNRSIRTCTYARFLRIFGGDACVVGHRELGRRSRLDLDARQQEPQKLGFVRQRPRIRALGVGVDQRSQPSRVEVGYTLRRRGVEDSRVACPVEVGMGSIDRRRAQGKSGWKQQLMDL